MQEAAAWGHRPGMQGLVGNGSHFGDPHGAGIPPGGSVCLCEQECVCACLGTGLCPCACVSVHMPMCESELVSLWNTNMNWVMLCKLSIHKCVYVYDSVWVLRSVLGYLPVLVCTCVCL